VRSGTERPIAPLACNSTELGFIRYEPSVRFITVGTQETDMRDSDAERQTASRRDYLRATGGLAAAGAVGLAGCMGGAEATTGTLATQVSDQPGDIGDFDTLQLRITELLPKPVDGEANVNTPGEAPLTFEQAYGICEGGTTTFTADFTPVKQGQSGGYVLQPVADEVTVETTCEGTATDTSG
jgi:hypothetical protein